MFTDEELRQVKPPCLLIIGEQEILYDPTQAAKRAAGLIPNLEVQILADAGHFLTSDQPEMVNEALLRFFLRPS